MKKTFFLIILSIFFQCSPLLARHSAILSEAFISPDLSNFDCHSSSLVEIPKNSSLISLEPFPSLLAIWKGGAGAGHCNTDMKSQVGIWGSRYEEGKWSSPFLIVSSSDTVCWNPVLTKLPNKEGSDPCEELLLFYRQGPDPRQTVSFIKRSFDGGHTWSKEEILPAGIMGPSHSKPIILFPSCIIAGSSYEAGGPTSSHKATACWIEVSEDAGRTWKKYGPLEIPGKKFGALEPSLFFGKEGELGLVCRDRSLKIGEEGFIHRSISFDVGKNWSILEKSALPNPDSSVETVDLGDGRVLLFYNDSPTQRFPLSLAISSDGGIQWNKVADIESHTGEFPAAVLASDGLVHLLYACKACDKTTLGEVHQRRIKHVVIDPSFF